MSVMLIILGSSLVPGVNRKVWIRVSTCKYNQGSATGHEGSNRWGRLTSDTVNCK